MKTIRHADRKTDKKLIDSQRRRDGHIDRETDRDTVRQTGTETQKQRWKDGN